jgi:hypothetical protein
MDGKIKYSVLATVMSVLCVWQCQHKTNGSQTIEVKSFEPHGANNVMETH